MTPFPAWDAARIPFTIPLVVSSVPSLWRIPTSDDGLRVHADDPDAVLGCADDRGDLGAVNAAERLRLLRIQSREIRPSDELRMIEVDARVDERHGDSGAWRRQTVHADR